jgi:hypothetical protein
MAGHPIITKGFVPDTRRRARDARQALVRLGRHDIAKLFTTDLGSDVIRSEMRGGGIVVGLHPSIERGRAGRTERTQVPCNDDAGPGSPHDLGCSHFRRDHNGNSRRIASNTVLPNLSEYEGSTKSGAAAKRPHFRIR